MLKQLKHNNFTQHTLWSFGGQIAFLLSNFFLFLLLINKMDQSTFGNWALYVTIVSLADAFRQGMVHNGLTRLIIQSGETNTTASTGAFLNYMIILILSVLALLLVAIHNFSEAMSTILPHFWKSLLVLGTLQFIGTLSQAQHQFKTYCLVNVIYLISFISSLYVFNTLVSSISLVQVVNIQLMALIPSLVYFVITTRIAWTLPKLKIMKSLVSFGRYAASTNLASILFHKADVLMIAFLLDPSAVALFHFATKIMNYAELPMHALSQVIYPRLSASYRTKDSAKLKHEYAMSIIRLLVFVTPICWVLMSFPNQIISLLSSSGYESASSLILILALAMMFKPFGRVFGLTLDAIGKPDVNFRILCQSLMINICMNLILIPQFGILGAAIATSFSIITTVVIGQMIISRYTDIKPTRDIGHTLKNQIESLKISAWN